MQPAVSVSDDAYISSGNESSFSFVYTTVLMMWPFLGERCYNERKLDTLLLIQAPFPAVNRSVCDPVTRTLNVTSNVRCECVVAVVAHVHTTRHWHCSAENFSKQLWTIEELNITGPPSLNELVCRP